MSVLVTGGAGYIGSHTVRRLQADGVDVVVLDSLEFGYRQSIPGVPLVVADITDRDAVARAPAPTTGSPRRCTSPPTRAWVSRCSNRRSTG